MKNVLYLALFFWPDYLLAQTFGSKDFIFEWTPNPTVFIKENHNKLLTDKEYEELLSCDALWFEVTVNLKQSKICGVRYSEHSSRYNKSGGGQDLTDGLKEKVSRILFQEVKVTPIRHLFGKPLPDEERIFFISLSLN